MAGGRMHTPHPTPLYPPLAISYRNHQKGMAYFSHLAPLILFFLLKGRVKGGMAQCPPVNTLLQEGSLAYLKTSWLANGFTVLRLASRYSLQRLFIFFFFRRK